MKSRIYFLDNLRTFLIFLVILLHAGLVYEPVLENAWIVIDPAQNSSIGLVRMYLDLFVMFTIFFISGYFIPVSLKNKSNLDFLKSKFKRIMVSWIVAVFTLIPAYKAIFLFARGLPQQEWFSYFHMFQRSGTDLNFFANNPTQNWLWFLPVLFLFQGLYLVLSRLNLFSMKISLKSGVLLTFLIGLLYSLIISALDLRGWFNSPLLHFQRERLLLYFMAFLLGSLYYKLNIFESKKKSLKYYILSNVVLTLSMSIFTVVALNFFFNMVDPARNYYFISEVADRVFYYISALLTMLSFLYVLIHVFRFNFNKRNKLMYHLNNSSYSVYIIHMIVLGGIALLLLSIPIPAFLKYLILTILTFVFSNAIVYVYNQHFQNSISLKFVAAALFIFALFTITDQKDSIANENEQSIVAQTKPIQHDMGIHEAVLQGNLEAVRRHITAGSDLDEKEPTGGSSPLISAAVFGKTEIALALIKAGANVNFKNNEGSTPLHTAAFFCRMEIVKALLENGADAEIKNNGGSTAFESVNAPFEIVRPYYDYFRETLEPLGLELDYRQIEKTRPIIANLLLQK